MVQRSDGTSQIEEEESYLKSAGYKPYNAMQGGYHQFKFILLCGAGHAGWSSSFLIANPSVSST